LISFEFTASTAVSTLLTWGVLMNQRSTDFGRQRRIEFGHYLKKLRKRRGKKQNKVEYSLGITEKSLTSIESGARPIDDELLVKLAEEYNVPLEEVLRARYRPQLPLLDGIMQPGELVRDLKQDLNPEDVEEVTRYIAFLLLKRAAANKA
jgi:transcriptional regulator with XRE-family HTH domain